MSKGEIVALQDIGDFSDVEIIEILVKPGDAIAVEDPILTLESDKATMEVPSLVAGTISEVVVAVGDKISQGDPLLRVESAHPDAHMGGQSDGQAGAEESSVQVKPSDETPQQGTQMVTLQDIGDFSDVEIIELLVNVGDTIAVEDPILTLESDKATMEVPSVASGKIAEIIVSVGDKISKGDALLRIEVGQVVEPDQAVPASAKNEPASDAATIYEEDQIAQPSQDFGPLPSPPPSLPPPAEISKSAKPHASPSVRHFARELGANLAKIRGTGPKGRITKIDVKNYIKEALQVSEVPATAVAFGPPPIPEVDFSQFGNIEKLAISKIKRITGSRLHRSWLDIPHVTHHDEADITELESFRKSVGHEIKSQGVRITVLAFICKAIIHTLREFPTFNASLSPDGESLILKKYFNLGIAVDTPNGLVVPVIKNVENMGVREFAAQLQEAGAKAREGKLTPSDFEGGCFTISSLGGIGGGFFTPIINPPEVAILGISRHQSVLVPDSAGYRAVIKLPLSLSYDHRVVDGAEAARFMAHLCKLLEDSRRILL